MTQRERADKHAQRWITRLTNAFDFSEDWTQVKGLVTEREEVEEIVYYWEFVEPNSGEIAVKIVVDTSRPAVKWKYGEVYRSHSTNSTTELESLEDRDAELRSEVGCIELAQKAKNSSL